MQLKSQREKARVRLESGLGALLLILAPMHFAGAQDTGAQSDPRNFEGVWRDNDAPAPKGGPPAGGIPSGGPPAGAPGGGAALPYTAEGQRIADRWAQMRQQNKEPINAHLACRPVGMAGAIHAEFTAQIVQTPQKLIFMAEEDRLVRQVFMNQSHPAHLTPTYMGHSIGHWEGNTLVVDTIGYNGRIRTGVQGGGGPTSPRLHTVERWTKSADGKTIDIVATIEDPVYYTKPFTVTNTLNRRDEFRVSDYDCGEHPREDDYAAWSFEDDWFKPTCMFPVKNGLASDDIVCTPRRGKGTKDGDEAAAAAAR